MDYRITIQLIVLLVCPLLGRAQFGMDMGDPAFIVAASAAPAAYDPCVSGDLVTQIRFTENAGTNAVDSVGSSDMDLYAGAYWTNPPAALTSGGKAVHFVRASSMYGRLSANPFADVSHGTVAFWIQFEAWGGGTQQTPFYWVYNTTNYVRVQLSSGNNLSFAANADGVSTSTYSSAAALTGWHHVAATWSETTDTLTLYLDGAYFATPSTNYTGTFAGTPSAPFFGKDTGGNACDASIADVRFYSTALSSNDIVSIYSCD